MPVEAWIGLLIASIVAGYAMGNMQKHPEPEILENPDERVQALAEILDSIPDAAILIDKAHRVIAASSNSVAMGLVSNNRLLPHQVRTLSRRAHASVEPVFEDLKLVRPGLTNEEWEVRLKVSPLASDVSLVIVQDLSQQRRLDEVRRDFVANVSHELKTPVGALSLLAEALQAAGDDLEARQRFTNRMQIEVRRLNELVTDLVELSMVQSEAALRNSTVVSVRDVVTEAVDTIKIAAEQKHIEIAVQEISVDMHVYGDEAQLVTAIRNLISNAIKYSPERTRVGVGAKEQQGQIHISIADQGGGIAESDQTRIFERFYRVDPARSRETGGTGLGLAIVKNVCLNHGGDVTVWSRQGQGSTFTVRLPSYSNNQDFGSEE